jgi:hypothetical protein
MHYELATRWLIHSGLQASRSASADVCQQGVLGRSEHACNCVLNGAESR